MENKLNAKLILNTYDGQMKKVELKPKYSKSKVTFKMKYYDKNDESKDIEVIFNDVIAIDFAINLFDNPIGSELGGFFEVLDNSKKVEMLEHCFQNRKNHYILHGYDCDANDPHDILNYRRNIDECIKQLDNYQLYQQETIGGIYSVLASKYIIKTKK